MNEPMIYAKGSNCLLTALRDYLRIRDAEYVTAEKACVEAVRRLKSAIETNSDLVDEYISVLNWRLSAGLRFLFWQGLRLNEVCFQDMVHKRFLEQDFDDICQENIINNLPESLACDSIGRKLHQFLEGTGVDSADEISAYYCHLETVGYKLVHYWGFQFGDDFLPKVTPGYVSDLSLTMRYRAMVADSLGLEFGNIGDLSLSYKIV